MFWSARLALPCRLFGSLLRTLAVLCTQQRCSRVLGHTSGSAFQKPSAPSATASSGPIASPRRLRSSRSSFHDCALSRAPSNRPTSSFLPSGVADDHEQAGDEVWQTWRDGLTPGPLLAVSQWADAALRRSSRPS